MTGKIQKIDMLIKNAKVFNNGETAVIEDVAITGGRIVSRGQQINDQGASRVIDAKGLWLMPGLFDIHTHYDLELEDRARPAGIDSPRHYLGGNCQLQSRVSIWRSAGR